MSYARGTTVRAERTATEIENLLRRHGCDQFMRGWQATEAIIGFRIRTLQVRIVVPMPDPTDSAFTMTPSGRERSEAQVEQLVDAEVRRRWRALLLVIKAKLEAIDSGIATLEQEFLSYVLLHDGTTLGDRVLPQLEAIATSGKLPKLLGS